MTDQANPTYSEIVNDYILWTTHIDADGLIEEEDFYDMDLEEKLDILFELKSKQQ